MQDLGRFPIRISTLEGMRVKKYCCATRHLGSQESWEVYVVMWTTVIVRAEAEVKAERSRVRKTKRMDLSIVAL
jgi:hypothetical protein